MVNQLDEHSVMNCYQSKPMTHHETSNMDGFEMFWGKFAATQQKPIAGNMCRLWPGMVTDWVATLRRKSEPLVKWARNDCPKQSPHLYHLIHLYTFITFWWFTSIRIDLTGSHQQWSPHGHHHPPPGWRNTPIPPGPGGPVQPLVAGTSVWMWSAWSHDPTAKRLSLSQTSSTNAMVFQTTKKKT